MRHTAALPADCVPLENSGNPSGQFGSSTARQLGSSTARQLGSSAYGGALSGRDALGRRAALRSNAPGVRRRDIYQTF